jgi:hypothetical protein
MEGKGGRKGREGSRMVGMERLLYNNDDDD